MIPVTKPFLPPLDEYQRAVAGIFDRNWLTNNGPLVNDLELKLKEYLEVPHILYLGNGTIALQIAIKALELSGEIITTPFSYVATTSSIVWENCKPVFVDIDDQSFNIDPKNIEKAITSKTSAILATHVYGNPCDIESIQTIAEKYNLKVIYDGAHGFGTKYKGESIFKYGDICTTSFHATKLFHTIEGGAVFTNNPDLLKKMAFLRNFGHDGPEKFKGVGINGKNSEFHAAMGLVNLKYIKEILNQRLESCKLYDKALKNFKCERPKLMSNVDYNYAYYPIVLPSELITLKIIEELNKHWIYPRRYFFPTLNNLDYTEHSSMPIAESVASRILCLPLYHSISKEEIDFISRILLRVQNNN